MVIPPEVTTGIIVGLVMAGITAILHVYVIGARLDNLEKTVAENHRRLDEQIKETNRRLESSIQEINSRLWQIMMRVYPGDESETG